MGYIRGNSSDQQRLWREGNRTEQLAESYKYPTEGFDEILRYDYTLNDHTVALIQVNDYANKQRLYYVHYYTEFTEDKSQYLDRASADALYDEVKRKIEGGID